MIVYDKLWETLKARDISQYKLVHEHHFSSGQLDRLRKGGSVNTCTLDRLCQLLHCTLYDIVEYREAEA